MLLRTFRVCSSSTLAEDRREIADVTLHSHFKYLVEPTSKEGFFRVDAMPFALNEPDSQEDRVLQSMFL
jgi:hypothetical protein